MSRRATVWRRLRSVIVTLLLLAAVVLLPILLFAGLIGFSFYVAAEPRFWDVSTSTLTAQVEQALKPGATFKECANCPEMVVVPSGSFMMGSPENEVGRTSAEGPQRLVTIATPFAVAEFEITSVEWIACVAHGGCDLVAAPADLETAIRAIFRRYLHVTSSSVPKPQNKVSWEKAKKYVAWIAKLTGKPYRLLTEAEWEYAARAGKQTRYTWGDEVGTDNATCVRCGQDTLPFFGSPIGKFAPNDFRLYDMHGSVSEWVEDCYHDRYDGAPTDGSEWTVVDCRYRVVRGGSRMDSPERLRSASRDGAPITLRTTT